MWHVVEELSTSPVRHILSDKLPRMLTVAHTEEAYMPHLAAFADLEAHFLLTGLRENERGWWVAHNRRSLLGALHIALRLDYEYEAQISGLYVIARARRQGVGSSLVHAALAGAKSLGANNITALVSAASPAVQFFRQLGFYQGRSTGLPELLLFEHDLSEG